MPTSRSPNGYIDFYGYHEAAGGWLFCGWVTEPWDGAEPPQVVVGFDGTELTGSSHAAFFQRSDLGGSGVGLLMFVATSTPNRGTGGLRAVLVDVDGLVFRLVPVGTDKELRDRELTERVRQLLPGAEPSGGRDALQALMSRRSFKGVDTLGELSTPVRVGIDETFVCPPDGLVLSGWVLAAPDSLRGVRLRCGSRTTALALDRSIRVDRADVLQAFPEIGTADRSCGFIAHLPDALTAEDKPYLEVETVRGEVGYALVPTPKLHGLAAIRRLLGLFDAGYAEVPHAFDVVGPGVQALNRERLAGSATVTVTGFGALDATPTYSIIVPLHGRIDFLEYQLAMFSRQDVGGHELIYVLDDPDRARDALKLAESAYERFRVPFRLVVLGRNLGFAPANNIGLGLASGRFTCFLNSDVFPTGGGWLPRLAARLDADPGLGAVGPLLLFEDGSVQHQGIVFEPLPQFGHWMFPQHARKGWKPSAETGLHRCEAITGACLVMRTDVARQFGGFDEAFVIGDFEDTDLCLRLARSGLACAVDQDVRMHHLERRSQVDPAQLWRRNVTLHNAWLHQGRWFAAPPTVPAAAVPAAPPAATEPEDRALQRRRPRRPISRVA